MNPFKFWIPAGLITVLLVLLAYSNANEYLFFAGFVVLQGIVLASAWNILGGYAGYVNFGVPGFVGVGAYTALSMHLLFHAPLLVQIVAGALLAAVLGLGDIGPLAGKPVMEGKGCLFKKFAGIDVFDIELAEKDPDKIGRAHV